MRRSSHGATWPGKYSELKLFAIQLADNTISFAPTWMCGLIHQVWGCTEALGVEVRRDTPRYARPIGSR